MSLIKCEECGKEISDKANTCPNCGCPIEEIKIIHSEDCSVNATEEVSDKAKVNKKSKKGWLSINPIRAIKEKMQEYAEENQKKLEEEKKLKEEKERLWTLLTDKLKDDNFIITNKIEIDRHDCILIDNENKKWLFFKGPIESYNISDYFSYDDIISYSIEKEYFVRDGSERIEAVLFKIDLSNNNCIEVHMEDPYMEPFYLEQIEEIKEWLEPIVNNTIYKKNEIPGLHIYDDNTNTNIFLDDLISYQIVDSSTSATSAVGRAAVGAAVLGPVGLAAGLSAKKNYNVILYYKNRTRNVKLSDSEFQGLLNYVSRNNIPSK